MSKVRADNYVNYAGTGAPTFPNGAVVTGVATATSFSGNVNGNVTGNITGTAATFTGNVTIGGTLTYEDVTNIDSVGLITARTGVRVTSGGIVVTAGVTTLTTLIPDETRFVTAAEKITRADGNTVSLAYNSSGSNVGFATNPSGDITLAVTGIPTGSDFDNHSLTFSVVVNQAGTARTCNAVTLNGVAKTIRWSGGTTGTGNTSCYDIFNFVGFNTVGSASTTANYEVLGQVNGDFRVY